MNISISDAAKILGVARSTIYALQDRGELPEDIRATDIMAYLQKKEDEIKGVKNRLGAWLTEEDPVKA